MKIYEQIECHEQCFLTSKQIRIKPRSFIFQIFNQLVIFYENIALVFVLISILRHNTFLLSGVLASFRRFHSLTEEKQPEILIEILIPGLLSGKKVKS